MNTVKKYLRLVAGAILINGFIISCKEDDNSDFIVPIAHNFKVTYGKDYEQKPAEKAQIILTNNEDGKSYKATTDIKGIAQLQVIPGTYKVNISRTLTTEEYETLFGQKTKQKITFNGSVENLKINLSAETETTIEMVTGKIGNLIFKQIYYAGSHQKLGADSRDQFIEIHNNSNQTLYLDGLYIAQLTGRTDEEEDSYYILPGGQFDFSKSFGQKDPEKANTDYFYSGDIIQFPGKGKDYPLPSGKNIIIASTAVNHKAPLTVTEEDGIKKTYKVPNPNLTIDLRNANFETYYKEYIKSSGREDFSIFDRDNPNVPNMKIVMRTYGGSTDSDLSLDVFGNNSLILFDAKEQDFIHYNQVSITCSSPYMKSFYESFTIKQIPKNVVIDGVELQNTENSKPKWLTDDVDAGQTSCQKDAYSSQSIIRKISSQKDGKIFYQDTNNSTNDFEVLNHPQVDTK